MNLVQHHGGQSRKWLNSSTGGTLGSRQSDKRIKQNHRRNVWSHNFGLSRIKATSLDLCVCLVQNHPALISAAFSEIVTAGWTEKQKCGQVSNIFQPNGQPNYWCSGTQQPGPRTSPHRDMQRQLSMEDGWSDSFLFGRGLHYVSQFDGCLLRQLTVAWVNWVKATTSNSSCTLYMLLGICQLCFNLAPKSKNTRQTHKKELSTRERNTNQIHICFTKCNSK